MGFVSDVYGKQAISNVLYMVRVSSSVEGGFRYATGLELEELISEVLAYSNKLSGSKFRDEVNAIEKGENLATNVIQKSPNGKLTAYISNELGQLVVRVRDEKTGKFIKRQNTAKSLLKLEKVKT